MPRIVRFGGAASIGRCNTSIKSFCWRFKPQRFARPFVEPALALLLSGIATATAPLITTGPFGLSRNPVYGSMTMLFIGIGTLIDGLWILAMVIPAILIVYFFVILKEEAFLEREFGDIYRSYKKTVRRWI